MNIIRRMAHIYDMYRMVKAVDGEIRRMDKLEPQPVPDNGHQVWTPAASNVKRKYMKRWLRRNTTSSHAEYVLQSCISDEHKYLLLESHKSNPAGIDVLVIENKGWKFIEKTLFIFPTGLWAAWYKEDGKLFFAIAASLIGLLGTAVGLLAKNTIIFLWNLMF